MVGAVADPEGHAVAAPQRRDPGAHLGDHPHGRVPGIEGILDPVVPVGAGGEQPVEDDVLGPGAHERIAGGDQHLAPAGPARVERLEDDLLLFGEDQAFCFHLGWGPGGPHSISRPRSSVNSHLMGPPWRRPWPARCPLAIGWGPGFIQPSTMISPETFSHIDNIKKRAGHLWRFL